MFYAIRDSFVEIEPNDINPDVLTVGCVTCQELLELGQKFGFDEDAIAAGQMETLLYQTGVVVNGKFTFSQLKIINPDNSEDFVSIYIKHNFLLIVVVRDEDSSTLSSFFSALRKYPAEKITEERIICSFIDALLLSSISVPEEMHNNLTEMEEAVVSGTADNELNIQLLDTKKRIRKFYNYYGQILDLVETLCENENDILNDSNLLLISNLSSRIRRKRDELNMLLGVADHIQSAYSSMLDQQMNSTITVLTVLTTIFFPLTIIVGWYGMNFVSMPELYWKYGYLYVIVLSVLVVALLVYYLKKKKLF